MTEPVSYLFEDRNTGASEDAGLAANVRTETETDNVSVAGSVDDQNNLIEHNLLPGEGKKIENEDDKKYENTNIENKNKKDGGQEHDVFRNPTTIISGVGDWEQLVVGWSDFDKYDRSAAAARQNPIKTSAVDWLLSLTPQRQLDSADAAISLWDPAGWGGIPNLAISVRRQILVSAPTPLAAAFDITLADDAKLSVAWPAVGERGSPYKTSELRGRPSFKHYQSGVSPQILTKITQTLDPTTAKFWQTSFQLRNEADAMWVLRSRAKGAHIGDNHLPILVTAWQYYFDAITSHAAGMVCSKTGQRNVGYAYNIYKDTNWVGSVAEQGKEIVNCVGMPQDYATFWAMCCLPSQEIFGAKTTEGGTTHRTPFGAWRRRYRTQMCVISEHTVTYPSVAPSWWNNPNLILSFLEMYSMRFGLDEQVNDALYVALQIPVATVIGAPLTLPEPIHSKDWFEGMVEQGEGLDAIKQLHLSSPIAVAAAWSTAQQVMIAMLGEVLDAQLVHREGVAVRVNAVAATIKQVALSLKRPGLYTATVLSKLMHFPTTALELTGLSSSFIPVGGLIPPPLWNYHRLAMWQHMLVPVRARDGFLNHGVRLGNIWHPTYQLTHTHLIIDSNELQVLRRHRLLDSSLDGVLEMMPYDTPWYRHSGLVYVPVEDRLIRQRLALYREYGIQFSDLPTTPNTTDGPANRDPAEAVELYNSWQYSGVCPSTAGSDIQYGGRAPQPQSPANGTPNHSSYSVEKAVKHAEDRQMRLRADIFQRLNRQGGCAQTTITVKSTQSALMALKTDDELKAESSSADDLCGWRALVSINPNLPTIAAAKRLVGLRIGKDPLWAAQLPDMLSSHEMAAIAAATDTQVVVVEHTTGGITTTTVGNPGPGDVLHLANSHWSTKITLPHEGVFRERLPTETVVIEKGKMVRHFTEKERVVAYNIAIEAYNSKTITAEELIERHSLYFPDRAPPRSMVALQSREIRPANDSADKLCPCGCADIRSNRTKRHQVANTLMTLPSSQYPHRNSTTAGKNNMSVTSLARVVASELRRAPPNTDFSKAPCAAVWLTRSVGQASEFVTSVGAWILVNRISAKVWQWLWTETSLCSADEDGWLTAAKAIHDDIRKNGFPPSLGATEDDWAQSLYLQALYGRGGVVVNWAAEFKNKVVGPDPILAWTGNSYSSEEASHIIKETIDEVVATAYPKALPQSFDRFMDNAYEWLVSGSTAGMPSALKNSPMRDVILHEFGLSPRPTKRSVMEAIPRSKVKNILENTSPKIVAKAHMKLNETGGKARAIYGVTMWHYIFSNWLMAPLEKHLNHPTIDINLDGSAMLAATVERVGQVEAGMVFNSYDYPDFNSMHTHAHMALIYAAARRQARKLLALKVGTNMDDGDVSLIEHGFRWLEEAAHHQYVLHPDTGEIVQTHSGLYSGNRDTTLINTLLNIAYARVVDVSLQRKDIRPGVVSRLCHGDDIITVHKQLPGAMMWNDEAARCNLKGQESKLMIDHHHHEYLRIMGCEDGKLRGSLARCIATFVNGNWETDRIIGVWAKLQETAASMATWLRRGADRRITQQLWNVARFALLTEVYGFTCKDAENINIKTKPPSMNRPEPDYKDLPQHVTGPYIASLVSELPPDVRPTPKEAGKLRRVLQKSTYGTELPLAFQQTDLTKIEAGAIESVANLGNNKGRVYNAPLPSQLRLTGLAKTDWQLRNRVKAIYHVLSALDIKSRHMSLIEVISSITNASKPSVARILEADAALERSSKQNPRWHLPAELASTITEIEWSLNESQGYGTETLLGTAATPDARSINDISTVTSTYNKVLLGDVLKY